MASRKKSTPSGRHIRGWRKTDERGNRARQFRGFTNIGENGLIFLAICTPRFQPEAYEDIDNPPAIHGD
jgi:hypothetical protein